jgi:hypothetical protein
MEFTREIAPFLLGILVSSGLTFLYRKASEQIRRAGTALIALFLGACTSLFAGELVNLQDGLIAILIDTSLVFTGATLSYYWIWGPISRLLQKPQLAEQRRAAKK